MKYLLIGLTLGAVIISGCASLNEAECLTADWYQIGYADGAKGAPAANISQHRKACAKHGITPDFPVYTEGHAEGVMSYCTPAKGFVQGKDGHAYQGVCPPSLEAGFLPAYRAGKEIHAANVSVTQLQIEHDQNKYRIKETQATINRKTALMLADATSVEERYQLNQKISQLQQDIGRLEERNRQIIVDLVQAQAHLQELEARYVHF